MAFALSAKAFPSHSGIQTSPHIALKPSNLSALKTPAVNFAGIARFRSHSAAVACYVRPLRPVEERFRIQVERNVDEAKLRALHVQRWSQWESDQCAYDHEWKVDEQVYIVKGCVRVTPEDCQDCTYFYAGDLVRFPKWFTAKLSFEGEYVQRYRFLAYGDD